MTTDIIELSKQVAEVLGVPPYTDYWKNLSDEEFSLKIVYLAEDSGRCADIANSKRMDTLHYVDAVVVEHVDDNNKFHRLYEYLLDHNSDRLRAYCVAVCKAVIEQGKQS